MTSIKSRFALSLSKGRSFLGHSTPTPAHPPVMPCPITRDQLLADYAQRDGEPAGKVEQTWLPRHMRPTPPPERIGREADGCIGTVQQIALIITASALAIGGMFV